jgi:salicylate hydroxylase
MSDSIAIIGGGLAGLTLSIGLTRRGIKHKMYESAAEFAEIGAGIAMGPMFLLL